MPVRSNLKKGRVALPKKSQSAKRFAEQIRLKNYRKNEIKKLLALPVHILTPKQMQLILEAVKRGEIDPNHNHAQTVAGLRFIAGAERIRGAREKK